MKATCTFCHRTFKSNRALSQHAPDCTTRKTQLRKTLQEKVQLRRATTSLTSQTQNPPVANGSAPQLNEAVDVGIDVGLSDTSFITTELRIPSETIDSVDPSPAMSVDSESVRPQRSCRARRLPRNFEDTLPEGPSTMEDVSAPPPIQLRSIRLIVRETYRTVADRFGLSRLYHSKPKRIPDADNHLTDLLDDTLHEPSSHEQLDPSIASTKASSWWPFPNYSAFLFANWFWNRGPNKSQLDRDAMLKVFADPDFKTEDVLIIKDWPKMDQEMDKIADGKGEIPPEQAPYLGDGWIADEVTIQVPLPKGSSSRSHPYTVTGLHRRSITGVIRDTLSSSAAAKHFHFDPFRQFWKSPNHPDSAEQRVHRELYTSEAFNRAHEELQKQPRARGDTLPRVVAALMFASDSTHLTSFGTAKIWPLYLCFGNQSKYERCRPSQHACHHIAYFPSLPDSFKDTIRSLPGIKKAPSTAIVTHCRRELMHESWKRILDHDFIQAYKHGIIIECADNITRRVFPRIFTYSADYPEKVLLATVRDMGTCPCPRCLVKKSAISEMGTREDMEVRGTNHRMDSNTQQSKISKARHLIYKNASPINGKRVEALLFNESLVPTENAFSERLGPLGFNLFPMLVVDLMHEFELGVWKALFTHLIRILEAHDTETLNRLNERFRMISPFGLDTIRRFRSDVSLMKKLAARDYEDILICCIPVFDGLLPEEHDKLIMDLLFVACHWQGLAKLRIHLDSTLETLSETTKELGDTLRDFVTKVCPSYTTMDTAREFQARQRRAAAKGVSGSGGRRKRTFNMNTYKLHALGDYVKAISILGTTDSYSTQISELEHRHAKRRYPRTNHVGSQAQMARIERREHIIRRVSERQQDWNDLQTDLPFTMPEDHHFIAKERRNHFTLTPWLSCHRGDPATKYFFIRLMDFLLANLRGTHYEGDEHQFTERDRACVILKNDRIYTHNRARFNYTTYDVRRAQDIINLGNGKPDVSMKRDILVLSNEDPMPGFQPHPFWYARVIGIYHCDVRDSLDLRGESAYRRMEFLWVRWLGRETGTTAGWEGKRLDLVGFEVDEFEAYGFLNPSQVVRGAHLIPAFKYGRVFVDGKPLPVSLGSDDGGDWEYYYANRFVDRDMMMRYSGGGIGHVSQLTPSDFTKLTTLVPDTSILCPGDLTFTPDTAPVPLGTTMEVGDDDDGDGDDDDDDDVVEDAEGSQLSGDDTGDDTNDESEDGTDLDDDVNNYRY